MNFAIVLASRERYTMIAFILPTLTEPHKRIDRQSEAEKQLVDQLKAGETKGIEKLYKLYSASLYGIIMKVAKNEDMAQDILQESFVKIWKSVNQYDEGKGKLFTWMARLCRNTAIDHLRSRGELNSSRNEELDNVIAEVNHEYQSSFNPETIDLKKLIKMLSPMQMKILDLVYFEGYTQVEAAEKLAIPVGTIKTRIRNAIITLRSFY